MSQDPRSTRRPSPRDPRPVAIVFLGVVIVFALIAGISLGVVALMKWQSTLSVESDGERVLELIEAPPPAPRQQTQGDHGRSPSDAGRELDMVD